MSQIGLVDEHSAIVENPTFRTAASVHVGNVSAGRVPLSHDRQTTEPNYYLLAQTRQRLTFTQTRAEIQEMISQLNARFPQHRHPTVLIEQAANGHAIIDSLRQTIPNVLAYKPQGSKIMRANAITPTVEAGNVYLPGDPTTRRGEPWVEAFLHEITTFPAGIHDDQVDAMSQALDYLNRPGPRLRLLTPL